MKSIQYILGGALLLCGLSAPVQAQSDINLSGYTMTFDDEFNSLSATTTSPKGASTWYAQPLNSAGYYSASTWDITAMSTSGGILSDKAFLDSNNNWHSGELLSIDPTTAGFSQTYGYFEIRCQMPNSGNGAWPAFWLDTTSGITGGQNEEVDIFEWYGICNTAGSYQDLVQQTSHNWNPDGTQNTTTSPYLPSTSTAIPNGTYPWQGYHVYGVLIDPVHMTWYIDGVQTNQCATPTSYMATPFFVELDYALGGGWPLSGMVNNSSFNVDWVRVYSLPTGAAPPAPTALTATPGNTQVTLSWTSSSGATSYNIYRGTTSGGESSTPLASGLTATTYADTAVTSGTTYYYEVKAVNANGTSAYSPEASGALISPTLVANGTYKVINLNSSLALGANGTTTGSQVQQQTYTGAATQLWTVTNLGNNVVEMAVSGTTQAMEVVGSSTSINALLDTTTYTGSTNQQWTITPTNGVDEIVNVHSGLAANVPGWQTQSGIQLIQYYTPYSTNQAWTFTAASGGTTTYPLTVNSGTGSGSYAAGAVVTVTANAPATGYQFAGWTGATAALGNSASATTTLTMPAAATAITATYAQAGTAILANGTYKVVNLNSSLALGASGTVTGSQVQQQTYTGASTQQWALTNVGNNVVELAVSGTSEAMEVVGAGTAINNLLDVTSYTGSTNQQWTVTPLNGYIELVNVHSGMAANVPGWSTTPNTQLIQFNAGYSTNQVWTFTAVGATTYALTVNSGTGSGSYASGTAVTVTANTPASGYVFAGWTGATSALANPASASTTLTMPAAATSITATYAMSGGTPIVANGTYEVVNLNSALALGAAGTASGSQVQQQTYTAAATQKWVVTNLGGNVVEMSESGASSEAMEVIGSSTAINANLDVTSYTGATNQQWTLTPTNGYIEIVNVNSGLAANVPGWQTQSGIQLIQYYTPYSTNQAWTFTTLGGGATMYALTVSSGTGSGSYASGTAVTVTANAPATGYQFAGWTGATSALANPAQPTTTLTMPAAATSITATYSLIGSSNVVANGTYKVNNLNSGLALGANGTTTGSQVQQQTYTTATTQKWVVTNLGSNVVEMAVSGTSEAMEVVGAGTAINNLLDITSYTGATNQQWTLTPTNGYIEIVNVNSGLAANVPGWQTQSGIQLIQYYTPYSTNQAWTFSAP